MTLTQITVTSLNPTPFQVLDMDLEFWNTSPALRLSAFLRTLIAASSWHAPCKFLRSAYIWQFGDISNRWKIAWAFVNMEVVSRKSRCPLVQFRMGSHSNFLLSVRSFKPLWIMWRKKILGITSIMKIIPPINYKSLYSILCIEYAKFILCY